MMAAQICARRGHSVILCEKSDHLGGRMLEASALYAKDYHRRYLDWDIKTTQNCVSDIRLNTEVTRNRKLYASLLPKPISSVMPIP